jgi:hypothetical protein
MFSWISYLKWSKIIIETNISYLYRESNLDSNRKPRHCTYLHISAAKNENFGRRNIPKAKQRETSFSDCVPRGGGGCVCLVRISVVVTGHDGIGDHLTRPRARPGAWHRDAQWVVRNQRAISLTKTDIRPFDWCINWCSYLGVRRFLDPSD